MREGAPLSGSSLISTLSSLLLKQALSPLKAIEMRMWLVAWSTTSQLKLLRVFRISTSCSSLSSPSVLRTAPQKSGIFSGAALRSGTTESSSCWQSDASSLLPRTAAASCWWQGCFNSSYLLRMASISWSICWLRPISCFLRPQIASQVSCSPCCVCSTCSLMSARISWWWLWTSSSSPSKGSRLLSSSPWSMSCCSSSLSLSLCLALLLLFLPMDYIDWHHQHSNLTVGKQTNDMGVLIDLNCWRLEGLQQVGCCLSAVWVVQAVGGVGWDGGVGWV